MGVQEIRFNIAQQAETTRKDQASDDVASNILDQIKKNISAKAEQQKNVGKQQSGERASTKFQSQFGGLLSGAQGPDKQKTASTFNNGIFQGANAQAKEAVTEKIIQGQLGFDTASQFDKDTTHPMANAALVTAEAKGMVVQTYADKKNLEKVGDALQEFFPAFANQDPKVQKGALRLNLEHPGSEAAKSLNKGIGNQSANGKALAPSAKEALINLAQRSDKNNPVDLKKALSFVNDPDFSKKVGDPKFAGVLSDFSKMTAKKPAVADDVAVFLKQYDKMHNMSSTTLRQCGQLIAARGGTQGLTGQGSKLAGALPDALKMARTESRQKAALRKLMEQSDDISEEDLKAAMTPKRRIDLSVLNDKEEGTPAYQAQLNLIKQKAGNLNKKVLQQVNSAKSRQGLSRIEGFANPAREFTNGMTDSKQLAELRGCSVGHAENMIKLDGEIEAQLKPMRTTLSKKQRELRKVNESAEHLRERPPLRAKANKTTFTLPNNQDGTSNVATFAEFLRQSVVTTASTTSAPAADNTSSTSSTAGAVAAKATKSFGNFNFQLGIDRDRQFFGGKAVKEPPKKEEKKASVTKSVTHNVATKSGQTLIKANTEFRPVGAIVEGGQFPVNVAERAVLRNLGVTRQVFESWVSALAKKSPPIIPSEFLQTFDRLPDHKQKTVELGGWTKESWNQNVAKLTALADNPQAVGSVAGQNTRTLTGGKKEPTKLSVGSKSGA